MIGSATKFVPLRREKHSGWGIRVHLSYKAGTPKICTLSLRINEKLTWPWRKGTSSKLQLSTLELGREGTKESPLLIWTRGPKFGVWRHVTSVIHQSLQQRIYFRLISGLWCSQRRAVADAHLLWEIWLQLDSQQWLWWWKLYPTFRNLIHEKMCFLELIKYSIRTNFCVVKCQHFIFVTRILRLKDFKELSELNYFQ